MTPLLWTISLSMGGLMALVLLFRAEDKRDSRLVLGRLRGFIDLGLVRLGRSIEYVFQRFGGGMLRQILHFVIHKFLRLLLSGVRGLEFLLRKLQRTNRHVAESIVMADGETHLSEVRAHRESIKLSDEEKRQKRRQMLE